MKGKKVKLLVYNFESGELSRKKGMMERDAKTNVWRLRMFNSGLWDLLMGKKDQKDIILPPPPAKHMHGRIAGSKNDYVMLGTNDGINLFYIEPSVKEIKPLQQDLLKWNLQIKEASIKKYESTTNWEKIMPWMVLVLLGGILLVGFILMQQTAETIASAQPICTFVIENITKGPIA